MAEDEFRAELLSAARRAAKNAYAPYSNFRVGAVVRAADGRVFAGVNVENASYGLTVCAERTALAAAVAAGARDITHLALACPDGKAGSCMPCGACRQWIAELAPNARVLIDGADRSFGIDDLLPGPFVLDR